MNPSDFHVEATPPGPEIDAPDFVSMLWLALGFLLIWAAIEYVLRDKR